MAYTGGEYTQVEFLLMMLKKMGANPSTTLVEYGEGNTTSTSYVTKKTWTVGSDGAILAAYRINPDTASASGYLRVQVDSSTVAEMSTVGSIVSGTHHIVGYSWDDNHKDCVDMILATNGDVINLDAKKYGAGTLYVHWLYMEYDV